MRKLSGLSFAAILALALSGPASATTITPGGTMGVGDVLDFSANGVIGQITFESLGTVSDISGLGGYSVLTGSFAADDIALVFSVALDALSDGLTSLGISLLQPTCGFPPNNLGCPLGAGTLGGAGTDVTSATVSGAVRVFWFNETAPGAKDGAVAAGGSSDQFFIVYDNAQFPFAGGSLSDLESLTNFMIDPVIQGDTSVQVTLVPEPGTVLLLGSGLAGLALQGRRTRRS